MIYLTTARWREMMARANNDSLVSRGWAWTCQNIKISGSQSPARGKSWSQDQRVQCWLKDATYLHLSAPGIRYYITEKRSRHRPLSHSKHAQSAGQTSQAAIAPQSSHLHHQAKCEAQPRWRLGLFLRYWIIISVFMSFNIPSYNQM